MTRCTACGASNPETASWCNQCYARMRTTAEPEPVVAPVTDAASRAAGRAGDVVPAGFRVRDGEAEWACPSCGTYTPVVAPACRACGTSLQERFTVPEPPRRERSLLTVLGLSALLPGAGHIAVGRYGTGVARALLFTVWLAGGVLLSVAGGGAPVAAPLVIGAVAVWVAGLADVVALSVGAREVLEGRALLWLVVAVTGLALVGAVVAAGTALPLS